MGWLVAILVAIVAVPVFGWLGVSIGRKAARANPGMAGALFLMMSFFKVDPPPEPKAEHVVKKTGEGAGDPPQT